MLSVNWLGSNAFAEFLEFYRWRVLKKGTLELREVLEISQPRPMLQSTMFSHVLLNASANTYFERQVARERLPNYIVQRHMARKWCLQSRNKLQGGISSFIERSRVLEHGDAVA